METNKTNLAIATNVEILSSSQVKSFDIILPYCFSEVNILWGAHQVHHSSEDYNLSTALRQSVIQNYTSWVSSFIIAC